MGKGFLPFLFLKWNKWDYLDKSNYSDSIKFEIKVVLSLKFDAIRIATTVVVILKS